MDNCLHIQRPANLTDEQWKALCNKLQEFAYEAQYRFSDEDWRACPHGQIESFIHHTSDLAAENMNCEDC